MSHHKLGKEASVCFIYAISSVTSRAVGSTTLEIVQYYKFHSNSKHRDSSCLQKRINPRVRTPRPLMLWRSWTCCLQACMTRWRGRLKRRLCSALRRVKRKMRALRSSNDLSICFFQVSLVLRWFICICFFTIPLEIRTFNWSRLKRMS